MLTLINNYGQKLYDQDHPSKIRVQLFYILHLFLFKLSRSIVSIEHSNNAVVTTTYAIIRNTSTKVTYVMYHVTAPNIKNA